MNFLVASFFNFFFSHTSPKSIQIKTKCFILFSIWQYQPCFSFRMKETKQHFTLSFIELIKNLSSFCILFVTCIQQTDLMSACSITPITDSACTYTYTHKDTRAHAHIHILVCSENNVFCVICDFEHSTLTLRLWKLHLLFQYHEDDHFFWYYFQFNSDLLIRIRIISLIKWLLMLILQWSCHSFASVLFGSAMKMNLVSVSSISPLLYSVERFDNFINS